MQVINSRLIFPAAAEVGEGALWDERRQMLWWVDIHACKVHRFDPLGCVDTAWDVGQHVGTVVLDQEGDLLLALRSGFARLDPNKGKLRKIHEPEPQLDFMRFNDGKCDPQGRFWAGTMAYDCRSGAGSLYVLDTSGQVSRALDGLSISNGLVWSEDGRTLFFIDSLSYEVHAYDCHPDKVELSHRRVVVRFDKDSEGMPDGMAIDTHGGLWVALFGGSCIVRIDPSSGAKTHKVVVPTSNITSCAFGGPELQQLYITSATVHLSPEQRHAQPWAGGLFVAEVPFTGRFSDRYGMQSETFKAQQQ